MRAHVYRRQPGQVAALLSAAGLTVEAQVLHGLGGDVPRAVGYARRKA